MKALIVGGGKNLQEEFIIKYAKDADIIIGADKGM